MCHHFNDVSCNGESKIEVRARVPGVVEQQTRPLSKRKGRKRVAGAANCESERPRQRMGNESSTVTRRAVDRDWHRPAERDQGGDFSRWLTSSSSGSASFTNIKACRSRPGIPGWVSYSP